MTTVFDAFCAPGIQTCQRRVRLPWLLVSKRSG
jgi:hypothetical protein